MKVSLIYIISSSDIQTTDTLLISIAFYSSISNDFEIDRYYITDYCSRRGFFGGRGAEFRNVYKLLTVKLHCKLKYIKF